MKKKAKKASNKVNSVKQDIQPFYDKLSLTKIKAFKKIEKELNGKILEVTMTIKNDFPELSKFIEEMPITIPDKSNPEITLTNLKNYHESLVAILTKYKIKP